MATSVDRKDPKIMDMLSTAPVYKKQGTVTARLGSVGEEITTILSNGNSETTNTVKNPTDWIMTNPLGEQYIIEENKFLNRYEPTSTEGTYQAKGYSRIMKNPYEKDIEIMASWGSPQYGNSECYFADT